MSPSPCVFPTPASSSSLPLRRCDRSHWPMSRCALQARRNRERAHKNVAMISSRPACAPRPGARPDSAHLSSPRPKSNEQDRGSRLDRLNGFDRSASTTLPESWSVPPCPSCTLNPLHHAAAGIVRRRDAGGRAHPTPSPLSLEPVEAPIDAWVRYIHPRTEDSVLDRPLTSGPPTGVIILGRGIFLTGLPHVHPPPPPEEPSMQDL